MLYLALAILLLNFSQASLPPGRITNDADALLRHALEHADFFNWADAGREFRQAENLFVARHDERNALYARIGFVRASMEDRSLTDVQNQLQAIIASPEVQRDPELLLFSSIAKADVDGEIDAQEAKNDWVAIEELAKAQNNAEWSVRALGEQSLSEFLTGNISRGRILIATALGGTQKAGDVGGQIRYLTAIGAALSQTHQFEQALDYLNKAADLVRSHPQAGYPFVTYEYKLEALVGLKDFRTAETLADEIITEAKRRNKKVKQAQAMITLARLQDQTHRTDQAIKTLDAASSLASAGNFKRLLADTQYTLADLYRARGDNRTAEVYLTRGLQITQDTSELWLMPARLQSLAQLKVADGRYKEADQLYHRATDLIDTLLGGTTNPQAELSLVAVNSEIFVQHFELAADHLKNTDDAYRVIEGARGREALDMLRGAFPPNRSKANPIDQNISRLRQQLAQAQNVKRRAQLKAAIFRGEQQRWTADASVSETVPRVADIVPLRRAQSQLSGDEAILEYVVGEHRVYCFVLTKRSAQVIPLASKGVVEKAIDSYLAEVEEKQPALNSGQELYKLLLAPIPDAIEKSNLIIVPDGKLHLLPWDALVDTTNHYLVETKNISYAPSVSTAMLLRNRSVVEYPNAFLGVGGLPYDKSGQLVASLRGSYPSAKLGNIPGSMDEVQDAAKLLKPQNSGVDLLVDANGTKAAFEKAILKRYSIIHLAVHGLADAKNPDHAALFLLSDKSTGTDGTLEAAEVLTLPIRTNLVVLSACETAVGRLEGQEGIATLSRAFLLAGARTVISTLWSIDDTFSRFLMVQFYTGIAKGQTASDALRNAKLELIKTFGPQAIPYRWAAYTLEGAGNYAVPLGPSHHEQRPNENS